MLKLKVPNESILVKDELLNIVKEEKIDLPNKRKEETKELQSKLKKCSIF
jgi:hypothetical protein